MTRKFYIEDITQNHTIISVKRNDDWRLYHLELQEVQDDDNFYCKVLQVQALDDDNAVNVDDMESKYIIDVLDSCDKFHDKYAEICRKAWQEYQDELAFDRQFDRYANEMYERGYCVY